MQEPALGNWAKLRDFALMVERKPYAQALASVGSLGCILVFRDAECLAERGYFLIGCSPTDKEGDIRLGFFTSQDHDPARLIAFSDSESAIQEFEKGLTERRFIPTSNA